MQVSKATLESCNHPPDTVTLNKSETLTNPTLTRSANEGGRAREKTAVETHISELKSSDLNDRGWGICQLPSFTPWGIWTLTWVVMCCHSRKLANFKIMLIPGG